MSADAFDDLIFGNSTPVFSFKNDKVIRGRITAKSQSHRRQVKFDKRAKTYEQGDLLYWGSDNKPTTDVTDRPMLDPVLTLQTTFTKWEGVPDSPDAPDDGVRRLFVVSRSKANPGSVMDAFRAACQAAKVRKVEIGDFVEVKRVSGAGTVDSPYVHAATYWSAANAPEWATSLPADVEPDDGDDDPFGD